MSDHDEPQAPRIGTFRGLLIAVMFVCSGSSALMYEVVWSRQLTTLFGSTIYAIATVLTAFMGGLALGSWLLGHKADHLRRPLVTYGLLELGIGVAALAFPILLKVVTPVIGAFYATGGEGTFYLFSLVRFLIAGALLMIPTTLMGATLPVMSRAVTRELSGVGRAVGGLYALNTTGAVLGVFLSGFHLLEHYGVSGTTQIAVGINVLVALIAIGIGYSLLVPVAATGHAASAPTPGTIDPRVVKVVLATYLLSGLIALAYQIAWTRSLIFSFEKLKATTYSFAGMLSVYLLGLAIGSALMQAVVDRIRDHVGTYVLLQVLLGISGALSMFLINTDPPASWILPDALPESPGDLLYWNAVFNVMTRTAWAIGVPTLLMGMLFPVVTRIVVGSLDRLGRDIGRVYALNTIGAILGSFLGGFILIPLLGIGKTILVLASGSLLIAASVLALHPALETRRRFAVAAGVAAAGALFIGMLAVKAGTLRYQQLNIGEKLVYYDEGPLATVSVKEDSKGWRTIYVDDVGVAGTDPVLQTDQKSLAHVPMVLLGGEAERVLTVGFGAGGASWSYTLYPGVKEIHAIEITTNVPRAAPTLTAANHGIVYPTAEIEALRKTAPADQPPPGGVHPLSAYTVEATPGFTTFDPRYRIIVDDARAYLRFADVDYDVIATDCTDLRYKTNANLYDLEYFRLCKERISDRGLVVVWMPLAGLSDEAFRIVVRTFKAVFPRMTVWYFTNQPTHYCLFIGAKEQVSIDYADVLRALEIPAIARDMQEIGLADPAKVVASFVCDERGIDAYVGEGPLNTEDTPIIEFLSPRYGYDSRPIAENMGRLYDVQNPVWDLIKEPTARALEDRDRIARYQQANDLLFDGHSQFRFYNFFDACLLYEQALAVAPEDASIRALLEFGEIELLLEWELKRRVTEIDMAWINAQWLAFGLGNIRLHQGRPVDAAEAVQPFLRRMPPPGKGLDPALAEIGYSLNLVMARAYRDSGSPARAREFLAAAFAYTPDRKNRAELEAEFR